MKRLTETDEWQVLERHAKAIEPYTVYSLKERAPERKDYFKKSACGIELDFSTQRLLPESLELLFSLADASHLKEKITALIEGKKVNSSEKKAALHIALRAPDSDKIYLEDLNVMEAVSGARHQMKTIAERIRAGEWLGFNGRPIRNVVNIGIGGSDLGPQLCISALADYGSFGLQFSFISDADPNAFRNAVKNCNPETTLFIVASKSFTTKETLYNAKKAMDWIGKKEHFKCHFIAVTEHIDKANKFGIQTVLPIWNWVGGRYSVCSAINLITAIALGWERFSEFLAGANQMDVHFKNSAWDENLPILLGLIGIWNNNFLSINNLIFLTYASHLDKFVDYVQQLDMESNGKFIDKQNKRVNYATGPMVWGGAGNRAQHSYYQLLSQGTHRVALDFISVKSFDGHLMNEFCEQKKVILSEGIGTLEDKENYIPGNIPINHLKLNSCSPYTVGALIALYEHKIYVQSVVWNINPFDQPGVESAKQGIQLEEV
tara:strand:- start:307 stop:1779 length:1473 start_codon:yes stop_codon:yes gene_type:complete